MLLFLQFIHASNDLKSTCLDCHSEEGIPNEGIYKRYLLKHSSQEKIAAAMLAFLQNPKPDKSAMPPRFIARFGTKQPSHLPKESLKHYIDTFIKAYDIKEKLFIPSN